MEIRPYRSGDEPALRAVFFAAIHKTAAVQYTSEQLDVWAPAEYDPVAWAERMRGIQPFIACDGDAILGYADLQRDGYIDHFFVSPWVARQGVGSALMRHLHGQAYEYGLVRMYSDVSLTARSFFEHWGFQVEQAQSVMVRGVVLQNYRMSKALSAGGESHLVDNSDRRISNVAQTDDHSDP